MKDMTAIEKSKEGGAFDTIMNAIDDFVKHGERTDLSGETRCVAYINKGRFTRWLKDNFVIRELAALEAEKPAEDARSLAIDISLGALDRAEFWEVIVPKRIHNFAHSYHLAECAKCKALPDDDVSEREAQDAQPFYE